MTSKTREPLFIPASFFMVRMPVLPIETFFALAQKKEVLSWILFLFKTEEFYQEALAVASPELYQALRRTEEKSQKEKDQVALSLWKYFIRMSTRPTPFGLFSSISMGSWAETSFVSWEKDRLCRQARPDMGWFFSVIDRCCLDPEIRRYLYVQKNPLLIEKRNRIYLDYLRKNAEGKVEALKNEEEPVESLSIRASFLTKMIFDLTKQPIEMHRLHAQILEIHPSLSPDKLQNMLDQLLEDQFLRFSLLPSLLTHSPLSDLLKKMPPSAHLTSLLTSIHTQLIHYQNTPVGRGKSHIKKLEEDMARVAPSSCFLQVDMAYEGKKIRLPHKIAEELSEAAEVLWRLSFANALPETLNPYHLRFLEKYGTHRTVPLLELLDEQKGLGVPEIYRTKFENPPSEKFEHHLFRKWLLNAYSQCLRDHKKEIEITEEVLQKTLQAPDAKKALLSFDLFCQLYAEAPEEIDAGRYLMQITAFSWQGTGAFARFFQQLPQKDQQHIRAFLQTEEALEKNAVFFESSYLPSQGRSANVAIHPSLRKQTIDLGFPTQVENTLSLEQIYVGATHEHLYLTTQDGAKEILVTIGNMLNAAYAPIALRFIRDVSRSKYQLLLSFPFRDLEEAEFLPRIRYKNTVLSAARWKANLATLGCFSHDKKERIEEKFQQWANMLDMPRYVLLEEPNNSLLLDRTDPLQLQEIVSELKKRKEIRLVEKINQDNPEWIRGKEGTYLSEFVVPFVKNKAAFSSPKTLPYCPISEEMRCKLPGSDWLYLKYYLPVESQDAFLMECLPSFISQSSNQSTIQEWFFIRYADPEPHLRIRFHAKKEKISAELFPSVHDWAFSLLQKGFINRFELSCYDREIERYGGPHLIQSAEDLFYHDSLTSIALLKLALPHIVLATLSSISLLNDLSQSLQQQIAFFSGLNLPKTALLGYRKHKELLLPLAHTILNEDPLEKTPLMQAFHLRKQAAATFAAKMQTLTEEKLLTTTPLQIQESLLHMHCNRLLGTDSAKEKKVLLYAYHTLTILNEKARRTTALLIHCDD